MSSTSNLPDDPRRELRWGAYALLIALSVGQMSGRLMAVNAVDYVRLEPVLKKDRPDWQKQRPFLSANDRSRWATVRALVEHGTYAVDDIVSQPNWDTIDMVKHYDREGVPRLYSSKPSLLPTLMAGEYWLIHKLTGWTLGTHPYEIGRLMLLTINVLPLAVAFVFLGRLIERLGTSDWGRLFVMAAATGATHLGTFSVVANNHIVAAVSVLMSLYFTVRIWYDDQRSLGYFAAAGLFAAFTAANELPALSWFALNAAALLWKAPRQTLLAYAPAALTVVAAFLGTDYLAHGTLTPAYAHRAKDDEGNNKDWTEGNWYNYTYTRGGKEIQSYWSNKAKQAPVDQGEESPAKYALHALVGHHGIFSLSPMWLLTVLGMGLWWRRDGGSWRALTLWIGLVTAACVAFYLSRPLPDRNYGGTSSGLRWVFWMAPLWLVGMLPAVDAARGRLARGTCLVFLAFSAFSAAYPTWNPWTHPWLVNLMVHLGWLKW